MTVLLIVAICCFMTGVWLSWRLDQYSNPLKKRVKSIKEQKHSCHYRIIVRDGEQIGVKFEGTEKQESLLQNN